MNIKQAISTNFTGMFHDMPEEDRAEQIKAIRYLQHLSTVSNISLDSVDLLEFSSSRGRLYTAKPKLNELFYYFSQKQLKVPSEKVDTASALIKELVVDITEHALKQKKKMIQQHKSNMTYYLQDMQNSYRSAENKGAMYLQEYHKLVALEGSEQAVDTSSLASTVDAILTQTDFTYIGKGGDNDYPYVDWYCFHTAKDIVIKYVNPVAGIDMTVNMGKYKIWISFGTAKVRILPLSGNLNTNPNYNGYYHPFVATNGEVCWGNYKDRVFDMFLKLQYADLFRALAGLLTQYSSDVTPYCQLHIFDELQKKMDVPCKCGSTKRLCTCKPCTFCGHRDCHCYTCPVCGTMSLSDKIGDRRCTCCPVCMGKSTANCNCCSICNGKDYTVCGCCQECNNTGYNCECDH